MASGFAAAGGYNFKGSMDTYSAMEGQKRESPAAERNKEPIAGVLVEHLRAATVTVTAKPAAQRPVILELASGSGQHAAHMAGKLPAFDIQPSDVTSELFGSIAAYAANVPNVLLPPLVLDATAPDWPESAAAAAAERRRAAGASPSAAPSAGTGASAGASGDSLNADAVLCINMCHISPLEATRGLLRGAGRALRPGGGLLFVYGPFTRDRHHTSESNAAFDASLRARCPDWGYRDLGDMADWAAEAGLERVEVREMPANNFMLVFRRP
ncbi:hypothetical protein GPECTOR_6g782 [Gonium pectorale]|uniref:Methyltransferase type 12 domain-containing protein n=1 Tax=Gonium pectorale TaxID=33097 RepID=A0A150GVP0_GONPE|nr:hypothetical protein GPECTOR_6g782 [Gonium pectorale]|eukprot:KXZ53864.1 hypothetical protein GPECTOR_6g782 [Gonium pectorale]